MRGQQKKKGVVRDLDVEMIRELLKLLEPRLREALQANERAQQISAELWDREFTV